MSWTQKIRINFKYQMFQQKWESTRGIKFDMNGHTFIIAFSSPYSLVSSGARFVPQQY